MKRFITVLISIFILACGDDSNSEVERVYKPVANAGANSIAYPLEEVILDASNSYDSRYGDDNSALSYLWRVVEKPLGANPKILSSDKINATFIGDTAGLYTVELQVVKQGATFEEKQEASKSGEEETSNDASTTLKDTDVLYITVLERNNAPVAVISAPADGIIIGVGESLVVSGAGSYDPDNNSLSYNWSYSIDEESEVVLSNHSSSLEIAKEKLKGKKEIKITLYVFDGVNSSEIVETTAYVSDVTFSNEPPVAAISELEDEVYATETVSLIGVNSSDDNDSVAELKFHWKSVYRPEGADDTLSNEGVEIANRTFVPPVSGLYVFSLVVEDSDGALSSPAIIKINVLEKKDE